MQYSIYFIDYTNCVIFISSSEIIVTYLVLFLLHLVIKFKKEKENVDVKTN